MRESRSCAGDGIVIVRFPPANGKRQPNQPMAVPLLCASAARYGTGMVDRRLPLERASGFQFFGVQPLRVKPPLPVRFQGLPGCIAALVPGGSTNTTGAAIASCGTVRAAIAASSLKFVSCGESKWPLGRREQAAHEFGRARNRGSYSHRESARLVRLRLARSSSC